MKRGDSVPYKGPISIICLIILDSEVVGNRRQRSPSSLIPENGKDDLNKSELKNVDVSSLVLPLRALCIKDFHNALQKDNYSYKEYILPTTEIENSHKKVILDPSNLVQIYKLPTLVTVIKEKLTPPLEENSAKEDPSLYQKV